MHALKRFTEFSDSVTHDQWQVITQLVTQIFTGWQIILHAEETRSIFTTKLKVDQLHIKVYSCTHSIHIQFKYFFYTISPYTLETDLGVVGDCIVQQIESISCNCCPRAQSRAAWCSACHTAPSPSEHNWHHYEHNYSVKGKIIRTK